MSAWQEKFGKKNMANLANIVCFGMKEKLGYFFVDNWQLWVIFVEKISKTQTEGLYEILDAR